MLAGALVRRISRGCRRFFAPWAGRPQGANSRKRVPPAPKIFEGGSPMLADAFTATAAATTTTFGLAGLGLEGLGIEGLGLEGLALEGLGLLLPTSSTALLAFPSAKQLFQYLCRNVDCTLGLEGLALESFVFSLPTSLTAFLAFPGAKQLLQHPCPNI